MTDIEKYKNYMDDCLRKTNRCVNINEKNCFILSNNVVIHIDMIKGMRALVVEYADNIHLYDGYFLMGDIVNIYLHHN